MRNSIRWRLVFMYVMLVVIVMMVSGTMIIMMVGNTERENRRVEMRTAAEDFQTEIKRVNPESEEALNAWLRDDVYKNNSTYADTRNIRIFILNTRAEIIYPEPQYDDVIRDYNTAQVNKAIHDGSDNGAVSKFDTKQHINSDVNGSDVDYMGYAQNVKINGEVTYIIYVLGNVSSINESVNDIVQIILLSVVVALVVAGVLGYVFSEFLTKPIAELSHKAREIQHGRMDQTMKVYANDEIGQLTKNFNRMAHSLNDTLNEITSEKNKLEIVFKHMTDGILVFDKIGMMIHSNPASVAMLKIDRQISFQEVFKPYLEVSFREMKDLVQEETISHMVAVEGKYYSIYFAKFLDQNNEAVGLICVIQDITEHKKLEEMQKEFVANVSHELRTPLTTIKSYAETLLDGALEDRETAMRFLNVINHEGDRMTALVQDLLELSKLDHSQVQFNMMDINLELILSESVERFKTLAEHKKQSIIYHPPSGECTIIGDANRVEQVIKNIVSNAIKYSQEEALIEISLKETSKYLTVIVSDNGMGISQEDLKRVFDRFYRVDKARSREMGGTGLGLAIAKEIMEFHGGKIEVRSEVGKGTSFELFFVKKLSNSY